MQINALQKMDWQPPICGFFPLLSSNLYVVGVHPSPSSHLEAEPQKGGTLVCPTSGVVPANHSRQANSQVSSRKQGSFVTLGCSPWKKLQENSQKFVHLANLRGYCEVSLFIFSPGKYGAPICQERTLQIQNSEQEMKHPFFANQLANRPLFGKLRGREKTP